MFYMVFFKKSTLSLVANSYTTAFNSILSKKSPLSVSSLNSYFHYVFRGTALTRAFYTSSPVIFIVFSHPGKQMRVNLHSAREDISLSGGIARRFMGLEEKSAKKHKATYETCVGISWSLVTNLFNEGYIQCRINKNTKYISYIITKASDVFFQSKIISVSLFPKISFNKRSGPRLKDIKKRIRKSRKLRGD